MLLKQCFNLAAFRCHRLRSILNSYQAENLATLQHLLTCGVISKGTSEKIAKLRLCYKHLQLTYERNGEDGIQFRPSLVKILMGV